MSRIGKIPVDIPDGVDVAQDGAVVTVEGPKGKLQYACRPEVQVEVNEGDRKVSVTTPLNNRESRAYHGLTRALIRNMIVGVKDGYEKRLEIQGVGYIASVDGGVLSLRVGFANEVDKKIPPGLEVTCPDQTHVVITGCDKQMVGQFAAEVRRIREPEPYKGKGIRYVGEQVKIKPGKSAT
ncbi:MAG: 50S ribosomal protein L6 [Planctomycetota bacterium]